MADIGEATREKDEVEAVFRFLTALRKFSTYILEGTAVSGAAELFVERMFVAAAMCRGTSGNF